MPWLQRLDRRLEYAIAAAHKTFGAEAETDPYRGMHIDPGEVDRLLSRPPGVPLFPLKASPDDAGVPQLTPQQSRWSWLQQTFELSEFDLEVIAIALAPELDRRYERLYAYLQDDVRCQRPSVDLALNLLCASAAERLDRRAHFATGAPLIHHALLHLVTDPTHPKPTLLGRELHLDDSLLRFLLGQPGIDERLTPFCQWIDSKNNTQDPAKLAQLEQNDPPKKSLLRLVQQHWQTQKPLRLYFQGVDRPAKRQTAIALATQLQTPLLIADLTRILEPKATVEPLLKCLFRDAWFQNAVLHLDGIDALEPDAHKWLLTALATSRGITLLSGTRSWRPGSPEPLGVVTLPFPMPHFHHRRDRWQTDLAAIDLALDDPDLDALADRFRLTDEQIADAIATAQHTANLHANTHPSILDLFAAARTQSGHELETLARKVEPKYRWDDIILPPDQLKLLHELCDQAKHRHQVYGDWGFERKLSLGKGLNVLFSGQPGTGKTMAAEVIAHELQLDLYKIDLSQVVSKYIGETEKNLDRIFTTAANSNAILLFDEADALFGKRSEIKDSHDRYANLEIGYLLQKMEEYEGIAILTTNLQSNLDDAFVRRLRFLIDFPPPNQRDRMRIWQQILPDTLPQSADLDLNGLARRFEITGANIRNIAVAAAFLAASEEEPLQMRHLLHAVRREYQKMGKVLMDE
nr:ATP-binding protein [Myxacorys almedinensis]